MAQLTITSDLAITLAPAMLAWSSVRCRVFMALSPAQAIRILSSAGALAEPRAGGCGSVDLSGNYTALRALLLHSDHTGRALPTLEASLAPINITSNFTLTSDCPAKRARGWLGNVVATMTPLQARIPARY